MLLIGAAFSVSATIINNKKNFPNLTGNTLYVGGDGPGNYTSIQQAIDNASDGDTVFVYDDSSPYQEHIKIDKTIELIGEDKFRTIILEHHISILASGVTVTGFSLHDDSIDIQNDSNLIYNNHFISYGFPSGFGGIINGESRYNTIYGNSFINCGIFTLEYDNNIYNNTVNNKELVFLNGASDKIYEDIGQVILHKCNNITIRNSFFGILINGFQIIESKNCIITGNLFNDVTLFCMMMYNSSNNIIKSNIFSNYPAGNLGAGLFFANCNNNEIVRNNFQNYMGNLWLENSSNNTIKYNNFYYQKRIINVLAVDSENNWDGNFWNRPRFLPYFIWNFNPPKLIPNFEFDRHPARSQNNIYYKINHRATGNTDILGTNIKCKKIYRDMFFDLIYSYPNLKRTLLNYPIKFL
jgi:parallel beta-helix repeat protein